MCWQKYRECTADTNFALRSHVPTVAIYNMFDDGEAEPCAAHSCLSRARTGLIEPIKSFRQSGNQAFGDAGTLVLDRHR